MQLTPSVASDPNLLALLFPAAGTAAATGEALTPGGAPAADTSAGFAALFTSLTTASPATPAAASPAGSPQAGAPLMVLMPEGAAAAGPLAVGLHVPADPSLRTVAVLRDPSFAPESELPADEMAAVSESELPAYRAPVSKVRTPRTAPALPAAGGEEAKVPGAAPLEAAMALAGLPQAAMAEAAPVRESAPDLFAAGQSPSDETGADQPDPEIGFEPRRETGAGRPIEPRVSHLHGMRWMQPAADADRSVSPPATMPAKETGVTAGLVVEEQPDALPVESGPSARRAGEGTASVWDAAPPARDRTAGRVETPRPLETPPLPLPLVRTPVAVRGAPGMEAQPSDPAGSRSIPDGLSAPVADEVIALAAASTPTVATPDRQRWLRPAVAVESKEANFAATSPLGANDSQGTMEGEERNFVAISPQRVAKRNPSLGTGVANSDVAMPSHATLMPHSHPSPEYGEVAPESTRVHELAAGGPAEALPAASDAHRAVEVVLHAVDRAAAAGQKSVKLEFSVGDADLVVRVELRDDEVRTTFRTDSADLRAALAQEWQGVAAATPGSLRLATAVITESREPGTGGSFGDATGQHGRHPAQSQEGSAAHSLSGRTGLASQASAAGSAAPELNLPRFAPAGTALRLNHFA